jgi:tRNA-dihydrouridine synthase
MGGVTDPASFEALFALGADAVQSASGAFANPYLARDCVAALGETLPRALESVT